MADAFTEKNTNVFRNSVTFVTGFGVTADEPFSVGSESSINSNLITYNNVRIGSQQSNRINFLGGASGSAPNNTATPFGWLDIQISGANGFKIPVYL